MIGSRCLSAILSRFNIWPRYDVDITGFGRYINKRLLKFTVIGVEL